MLLCKLLADQAGSANIVAGHPSEFRQELCAIIIDGTYTYISVIDTAWRESTKACLIFRYYLLFKYHLDNIM